MHRTMIINHKAVRLIAGVKRLQERVGVDQGPEGKTEIRYDTTLEKAGWHLK